MDVMIPLGSVFVCIIGVVMEELLSVIILIVPGPELTILDVVGVELSRLDNVGVE